MPQVLMVDDDSCQLKIREMVLRGAGLTVQLASNVDDALELLRTAGDQIGMVITDHCLSGLTGADLVRQLRLTSPELPVAVLSGMPGIASEYEGLNVSVWMKPLPPKEFIELVQSSLSK